MNFVLEIRLHFLTVCKRNAALCLPDVFTAGGIVGCGRRLAYRKLRYKVECLVFVSHTAVVLNFGKC